MTRCCTRQHLTPEEWGVLEDCTRLSSGGKNWFILDGRKAAARFSETGKDAIYRVIKLLERKGWLVRISGGTRNNAGMYDSTVYKVIVHEDWIKGKGRTCPDLRARPGLNFQTGAGLDLTNHQSGFDVSPVEESRHSSVRSSVKNSTVKTVNQNPVSLPPTPTCQDQEQKRKLLEAVNRIARLHPGNKQLQADIAIPKRQKVAIEEAIKLDGEEKVLRGTAAAALAVAKGNDFVKQPYRFYSEGDWRKDEREWHLWPGQVERFMSDLNENRVNPNDKNTQEK
jgi:hypothetical protein